MTFMPFTDLQNGAAVFALLGAWVFIILLFGGAAYIMQGIAFLQFARRTHTPNGWLGFIPVASTYLMGRISDAGYPQKKSGRRLLIWEIIVIVLCAVETALSVPLVAFAQNSASSADYVLLGLLVGIIGLFILAATVCILVFEIIALCRIANNFGGASAGTWTAGIIISLFCCQIAFYVILLILSCKTPRYTENDIAPTV